MDSIVALQIANHLQNVRRPLLLGLLSSSLARSLYLRWRLLLHAVRSVTGLSLVL